MSRPPFQVPAWLQKLLEGVVTEINFDGILDASRINTHYSKFGVTLTAIPLKPPNVGPGYIPSVYARYSPIHASPSNVASIIFPIVENPAFDETLGGIQVTFSSPQVYVSLNAYAAFRDGVPVGDKGENKPYLKVYGPPVTDVHGNNPFPTRYPLLATVQFPLLNDDPNFQSWQTLHYFSTYPNISSIVFSSSSGGGPSVYGYFDRLAFAHSVPLFETIRVD